VQAKARIGEKVGSLELRQALCGHGRIVLLSRKAVKAGAPNLGPASAVLPMSA
jgi:hypothetical protein